MKKLASLLLSLALLLSCCAGLTEELVINPDDIQIELPDETIILPNLNILQEKQSAADTKAYQVEVDGSKHLVQTGTVTFKFDLPETFLCVTQDPIASLETYWLITENGKELEQAEEIAASLAEENIHLLVIDAMNGCEIWIMTLGSDSNSAKIDNLSDKNDTYTKSIGTVMAQRFGCEYSGFYRTELNNWMCLNSNILMTIVNGEYVAVLYRSDPMTEDEITALHEIADALQVY